MRNGVTRAVAYRPAGCAAVAGDHSEAGGIGNVRGGVGPVRVIEEVGRRHLPAQPGALVEKELLGEPGAPNVHSRADDHTLAGGTELAGLRRGERSRVEPPIERWRPGIGVLQDIRPDGNGGGRGGIVKYACRIIPSRTVRNIPDCAV